MKNEKSLKCKKIEFFIYMKNEYIRQCFRNSDTISKDMYKSLFFLKIKIHCFLN